LRNGFIPGVCNIGRQHGYLAPAIHPHILGQPQRVDFHGSFLSGMPPTPTPGSPTLPTLPSPNDHRLGTPDTQSVPRGRSISWLHWFASATALRQVARPPVRIRRDHPAFGNFYFQAFTDQSPFPLLDITTTATGPLCWRDSHPLAWQLASLRSFSTETGRPHDVWCTPIATELRTSPEVPIVPQ